MSSNEQVTPRVSEDNLDGKKSMETPQSPSDIPTTKDITAEQPTLPEKSLKDYISISLFCILVAFGGFVFGFDTGTISGFVNMTDYKRRFGTLPSDGTYGFTDTRTGVIVAIFNAGCAIGGIFLSKIADVAGRRMGLMFSMIIYVIGIIVQITSTTKWYQIVIGRAIAGLAVGCVSVLSPLFIGETAPKMLRGTLVCSFQLFITMGIFLGYCTTYGTKQYDDARQWRIPLGLCFKAVGMADSFQTSIVLGIVNFASTFVGIYAIERLGRRMCLLIGSVWMTICFIIYSVLGSVHLYRSGYDNPNDTYKSSGNAMIFITCLFIFFFASTWAGGVYSIISEIYPLRIRSKAMSVATAATWIRGFLISFFSPFITSAIHFYYGFVFTGCLIFSFFYVYFFVYETKGLSLEEVDELYAQKMPAWKSSGWVPPSQDEMATSTGYARHTKPEVDEAERV